MIAVWIAYIAAHPWLELPLIALAASVLATLFTVAQTLPDGPAKSLAMALLAFVRSILDRLSFKPMSDAEPHFTVRKTKWKIPGPRSKRKLAVLLPFLALLAFAQAGCCMFGGTCKAGSLGDCTRKAVQDQASSVVPVIVDIWLHKGVDADIAQGLIQRGITVAADDLACLVEGAFARSGAKLAQIKSGNLAASPEPWLNLPAGQLQIVNDGAAHWRSKHGK